MPNGIVVLAPDYILAARRTLQEVIVLLASESEYILAARRALHVLIVMLAQEYI